MRFLIAATVAALACGTGANAQIESEIEVLRALARSTGNWDLYISRNMGPWLESTASTACQVSGGGSRSWNGVICERIADQDRVVAITVPSFPNQQINGTISNIDFNKLPYLRLLEVVSTDLTGTLPNLSTHPTLKNLKVWWNDKITAPITTSNIPPQLEEISIRNPIIQGNLPSFDAVNATTLKTIYFVQAQVTGTLPSFQRFTNLQEVNMYNNNITGAVPPFGPSLRELSLGSNQLTSLDVANIPPSVQILELSINKIVSPFPDLSKLTDPKKIELYLNGFYGNVPLNFIPAPFKGFNTTNSFSDVTYFVDFSLNYLTGPVPSFTSAWLQSRAAPGVTHKLSWSTSCNFFQTGLPSLPPASSSCYDNKDSTNCQSCNRNVPTPPNFPTPNPTGTPPPNKTNTTNAPPTKPVGPKNYAATTTTTTTTTATSVFTGIIATVAAALIAHF